MSWAVVLLGVVAVVATVAVTRWRSAELPAPPATATVSRGDIAAQVTASGVVSPVDQVQVGSQVSGRIERLLVDFNDRVQAGQVIAELDRDLYESALAQARARLAAARAALTRAQAVAENARVQHGRLTRLAEAGTVATAEVDAALAARRSADAEVVAARAEITVAQAVVGQAQINLDYTTIRSPIDGVVVSRSVELGQTVAATLAAPILFTIAGDLRRMEVHTSVAEADVGQVEPGMKVAFTVDAFPDRSFDATVAQVRFEPVTVSNVVTYDAVIGVANDDLALRPGMTGNVVFVTAEARAVLRVANQAFRYRPAAARPTEATSARPPDRAARTIYRLVDGRPQPVRVITGLTDGSLTEIARVVEGELREGDLVITAASGEPASGTRNQGGRRGPPPIL